MRKATLIRNAVGAAVAAVAILASTGSGDVHAGEALNVDGGDPGCSDALGTPYCTIGGAVSDADAGVTINVYPGTYAESVDLSSMSTPGDISLIAVNDSGVPAPSGVSIEPAAGPAIGQTVFPFPGEILIDGFTVTSPDSNGVWLNLGGDLTVANVTANGNGGDGLNADGNGNDITVSDSVLNDNAGDGFNPFDSAGTVSVSNVVANDNAQDGMEINTSGPVTVSGSTANGNLGIGFGGNGIFTPTIGPVSITGSTADGNGSDGFEAHGASEITITDSSADENGNDGMQLESAGDMSLDGARAAENDDDGFQLMAAGDVDIQNTGAHDNGNDGIEIDADGSITVDRSASTGNANEGLNIDSPSNPIDSTAITNSVLRGNTEEGIDYSDLAPAGSHVVSGSIICQNNSAIDQDTPAVIVDARANWWGHASGPFHPVNNPAGLGDEIEDGANGSAGTVTFDPWLDTITGSNGPASAGQPKTLLFEVTDTSGTMMFMEGPGDPNGPPVFSAQTDNGSVETTGFISGGTLAVTLTADSAGTATVSITGPCGLGESTAGNSVTVNVEEAGQAVLWGDNNCSGAADPVDSLLTLRYDAALATNTGDCPDMGQEVDVLNASLHPWGDIDCSGVVNPVDSLKLLRFDAGLSVSSEPGCPDLGDEVTIVD